MILMGPFKLTIFYDILWFYDSNLYNNAMSTDINRASP